MSESNVVDMSRLQTNPFCGRIMHGIAVDPKTLTFRNSDYGLPFDVMHGVYNYNNDIFICVGVRIPLQNGSIVPHRVSGQVLMRTASHILVKFKDPRIPMTWYDVGDHALFPCPSMLWLSDTSHLNIKFNMQSQTETVDISKYVLDESWFKYGVYVTYNPFGFVASLEQLCRLMETTNMERTDVETTFDSAITMFKHIHTDTVNHSEIANNKNSEEMRMKAFRIQCNSKTMNWAYEKNCNIFRNPDMVEYYNPTTVVELMLYGFLLQRASKKIDGKILAIAPIHQSVVFMCKKLNIRMTKNILNILSILRDNNPVNAYMCMSDVSNYINDMIVTRSLITYSNSRSKEIS